MKRLSHPILASVLVSLILLSGLVFPRRTHAQLVTNLPLQTKISIDLLERILEGRLLEPVRVVIQPTGQPSSLLDWAIQLLGGSNVRKLDNLGMRVATVQVTDVIALALRKNTGLCELARGSIGSDACPVLEG